MPVPDVDGGLNFQGFSPRILTGKLPDDQSAKKPFYGASEVPYELAVNKQTLPTTLTKFNITSKVVHKLPSVRK